LIGFRANRQNDLIDATKTRVVPPFLLHVISFATAILAIIIRLRTTHSRDSSSSSSFLPRQMAI